MPSDSQLPAKAVNELQDILGILRRGEDPEIEGIVEARDEVLEQYQPIFSREHLRNLTEEEFQSFLRYDNNRHWTSLARWGQRIAKDMNELREALLILTDEDRPIVERLRELRPASGGQKIKGLSKAIITPILLVHDPATYGVWNQKAATAMQQLQVWPEIPRHADFADKYVIINSRLNELAETLDTDLWTLDALWYRVAQIEVENADQFGNTEADTMASEPTVWWVNQGRGYEPGDEFTYIYARQETEGGQTPYYHENVRRVEERDIIVHYAKTKIRALSRVKAPSYETEPPESLSREPREQAGWRADVEAVNLENPIHFEEIPEDFRLDEEASVFDRNGKVNQGYLYELPPFLVQDLRTRFADRWPTDSPWGEAGRSGSASEQLRDKAADAVQESLEAGQGFASSAAVRGALEEHSMSRAEKYFQEKGFKTKDVSGNRPYDLRCEHGDLTIHVEVKGTQTDGETVILTANEVGFARDNSARMVLFVVHSIEIDDPSSDNPTAIGGTNEVYMPWDVDEGELSVINYRYDTPDV